MLGNDLIALVSQITNERAREYITGKWLMNSGLTTQEWADKLGVALSCIYDYNYEYKDIKAKIVEKKNQYMHDEWELINQKVTEHFMRKVNAEDEVAMRELLPYIRPKKEHIAVDGDINVNQPLVMAIKGIKDDKTDIVGGENASGVN